MYEDAACNNPCGGEPMACGNCPELRSSEGPPEYDYDAYPDYPDPEECEECGAELDEMKRHFQCPDCGWTCPY